MCGIAGIINFRKPVGFEENAEMEGLLRSTHYRGRDATGYRQCSSMAILGSNRMRITDHLNDGADMPLSDALNRYTIVFNGEIYNRRDIRSQCPNFPYKTLSDTESILAAYDRWGEHCLDHLEGMFSFCLYDHMQDTFLMAVDPTRQKPFFFLQDDNAFVFSSDMNALVADAYRKKTFSREGIGEIIAVRFACADQTQFNEIKKLKPGHKLVLEQGKPQQISRYYTIPVGDQNNLDIDGVRDDIFHAAEQACRDVFDVELPSAAMLSGGIDSSAVTFFGAQAFEKLKTFSIGFRKSDQQSHGGMAIYDEFEYSDLVSQTLGTDHKQLFLSPGHFCANLEKFSGLSAEPVSALEAPSFLNQFDRIAQENIRIVFMGNGADEMFDGYRYGARLKGQAVEDLPQLYYQNYGWTHKADIPALLPDLHKTVAERFQQKIAYYMAPYRYSVTDIRQMIQIINLNVYCADCDNPYIDRTSMAHHLEVRNPLLDRRMIKAAFAFDPDLKMKGDNEKFVFKEAFRGRLPDKIVNRKKVGFTAPASFKFSKDFEEMMQPVFDDDSPLQNLEIVNRDYMRDIWSIREDAYRNIFYRFMLIDRILRHQKFLMQNSVTAQELQYLKRV